MFGDEGWGCNIESRHHGCKGRLPMKLTAEQEEVVEQILKSRSDDFVVLAKLAGIDPKKDCRYANFRGVNFGNGDYLGWNFSGADLREADFRNASTIGAIFDDANVERTSWSESWSRLESAFQNKVPVQGVIFTQVKGGFSVDLDGAVAFLPSSQVGIRPIRDVSQLMNLPQSFQILKMDRRRGNIVVSRRTLLKQTTSNPWEVFLEKYPPGSTVEGEVKNKTEFGLFLGLDGEIDGMVHLSDLDWRRPGEQVIEEYKKGDKVKAQVLDIDVDKERISLGIKQLAAPELYEGAVVTCEVVALKMGGIDVKIVGTGLTAFIKRSELARDPSEQRPDRFAVGQKVEARVIDVLAPRWVSVSIKALEVG
jgi:ribosomal protein S1